MSPATLPPNGSNLPRPAATRLAKAEAQVAVLTQRVHRLALLALLLALGALMLAGIVAWHVVWGHR